ncbi:AraC family transcriptional regulator [Fontibacillus sp. BL9]|uniref:AraC family transcriptional regulator n=1 Tax=Fontibacillus sp. BL9 TaxID=3389971 RepID=UPI00397C3E0F
MSEIEFSPHFPPLVLLNRIELCTLNNGKASCWLESHTLIVITGGSGEVSADGCPQHAARGKCFLLQPEQAFHLRGGESPALSYFLVSFSVRQDVGGLFARNTALVYEPFSRLEDQLHELLSASGDPAILLLNRGVSDPIIPTDEAGLHSLKSFHRHIRFQTMLYEVLYRLQAELQGGKNDRQAVERSIDYLHRAYREDIGIGRLAQEVNMSRWQYGSLFKSLTGQTPVRYLNNLRIEQAKRLLATSSARVSDVAARVGFRDEYYFSRRFKQTTGMSPTRFAQHYGRTPRIFSIQYLGELLALGIRPIGTNRSMLSALPEACADVSPVDEPLDVGQLLKLEPDLILYPSYLPAEIAGQLSRVATTVEIDWEADVYTRLQEIGGLLGRAKEADEWIERYKEKAIQAKALLKNAVCEGETAAAFIVHMDGLFVYAGHHFGHTLYQGIGFEPSPGIRALMERNRNAKWQKIRMEDLPEYAGDRIFLALPEQGEDAGIGREILRHPIWESLPAVRQGKSYVVKDRLANYNPVTLDKHLDDTVTRLLQGHDSRA